MAASLTKKRPGRPLDKDSARRAADLAPHCTVIFEHFLDTFSSRSMAIQGCPRRRRPSEAATLRRVLMEGPSDVVWLGSLPHDRAGRGRDHCALARGADHLPLSRGNHRVCTAARRPALDGLWRPRGLVAAVYAEWAGQPAPEPKARVDISLHR